MPKRKRPTEEESRDRAIQRRKSDITSELTKSKKLLHRALKTAKGFERQKLSKRLKSATTTADSDEVERINGEIEALKGLDLDEVTQVQLYRNLLKVRGIREAEGLPESFREAGEKGKVVEGGEEREKAARNVISGLCNAKVVKGVVEDVKRGMAGALGVRLEQVGKEKKKKSGKGEEKEVTELKSAMKKQKVAEEEGDEEDISEDDSWEGLNSQNEDEGENQDRDEDTPQEDKYQDGDGDTPQKDSDSSLDEEVLQKYDALLGPSSDEESFHAEDWLPKPSTSIEERTRFSFSPSPSLTHSISPSPPPSQAPHSLLPSVALSLSPSPSPEPAAKKPTKKEPAPTTKTGASTFLPSLLGGYWSGSDSEPEDLDSARPAAKKNRPGQMARRAIWEKKFGAKAKHITSGQGSVADVRAAKEGAKEGGKDDGWDAKRGAKDSGGYGRGSGRERGGRRGGEGGERNGPRTMNRKERRSLVGGTGENAMPIAAKAVPAKMRDDVGVLHPSWQAAKKSKEMKKTASFQGKKVTFD